MDRKTFVTEADRTLADLERRIADLELEQLEPDLAGDVLTLEFADGTKFIINAHSAARQIWMAAGTEAWHFDYDAERDAWIASKNGDELYDAVRRVLSDKLGFSVDV
ncbi:MAG: iron donor protein CyaY [Deltaproteobacteria bacterium]|nr:MAG: iron donor protein CyaY [Deltaproteobacteria bacterium]